jgi:hypothetical protein
MKIYQLSKIAGKYWYTGKTESDTVPEENDEYKWTSDENVVFELNGKPIK